MAYQVPPNSYQQQTGYNPAHDYEMYSNPSWQNPQYQTTPSTYHAPSPPPTYPPSSSGYETETYKPYADSSVQEHLWNSPSSHSTLVPYREKSKKAYVFLWLSFFGGLLWLAPAVYLLYVNIGEVILGATAWCPSGECTVISYQESDADNTYNNAAKANENDRDLLGVLQLAAKALEVWFVAICGSLVYTVSRMIAKRPGGLPIGYLLTHLEFGDLRNLLNPAMYTSSRASRGTLITDKRTHRWHLWIFIAVAVFTCIVSNLVGPMTAVLMIPSVDWTETQAVLGSRFDQVRSAMAPSWGNEPEVGAIYGCSEEQLSNGEYSCFNYHYGSALDSSIEGTMQSLDQLDARPNDEPPLVPLAPAMETVFPFSYNASTPDKGMEYVSINTVWAPNRQAIRELAADFEELALVMNGSKQNDQYTQAKSSLQIQLQRESPIVGTTMLTTWGNLTNIRFSDGGRAIRCINEYVQSNTNQNWYTKCFQYGEAWGSNSTSLSLTVDDNPDPEQQDGVVTFFYWAEKSAYIEGNDVTQWDPCMASIDFNGGFSPTISGDECDWDALFDTPTPEGLPALSKEAFISEYWPLSDPTDPLVMVAEMHPFSGVASYSADVTEIYPNLQPVIVPRLPGPGARAPIRLHADWVRATWCIDQGVTQVNTSTTSSGAGGLGKLKLTVNNLFHSIRNNDDGYNWNFEAWSYVAQTVILHTLSMVTYDTTDARFEGQQAEMHQQLQHNLRARVWKWGLDTRTSKLAVFITGLACVMVIIRCILLLVDGEYKPSTVELVISAMEHKPQREFEGKSGSSQASQVRFRMHNVADGKIEFHRM